ncbi:MAG: hypothetical protein H6Q47_102 [Deltaproteobacteria bacterium]|jgi:hypothetical protein|nr:hypothetical protein [Deltaproteobacteria bacterium]
MNTKRNGASLVDEQQISTDEVKEINVTAMMAAREMLGWSQKTLLFPGETLAQFLKQVTTLDGNPLFNVLVQEDGSVKQEYMVWLNNRPIKEEHSLEIPLQHGDRVLVTSMIKFAAGG